MMTRDGGTGTGWSARVSPVWFRRRCFQVLLRCPCRRVPYLPVMELLLSPLYQLLDTLVGIPHILLFQLVNLLFGIPHIRLPQLVNLLFRIPHILLSQLLHPQVGNYHLPLLQQQPHCINQHNPHHGVKSIPQNKTLRPICS